MTLIPSTSKMRSSAFGSSSASAYWKPEHPPPRTPTRRTAVSCPARNPRTFSAALAVSVTIVAPILAMANLFKTVPTTDELKQRIEQALPGADVRIEDLNGTGDHFRAEVVSDRFGGLTRIEQHKLVYDVFGNEIGGPIHALSLKTSIPGGAQ